MSDLIDSKMLILRLKAIRDYYGTKTAEERAGRGGVVACICAVHDFPTVDAEPVRHGRWIPIEYDSYADGAPLWNKWECSECYHEHNGEEDTLTDFCPDCGARMDGDGE